MPTMTANALAPRVRSAPRAPLFLLLVEPVPVVPHDCEKPVAAQAAAELPLDPLDPLDPLLEVSLLPEPVPGLLPPGTWFVEPPPGTALTEDEAVALPEVVPSVLSMSVPVPRNDLRMVDLLLSTTVLLVAEMSL